MKKNAIKKIAAIGLSVAMMVPMAVPAMVYAAPVSATEIALEAAQASVVNLVNDNFLAQYYTYNAEKFAKAKADVIKEIKELADVTTVAAYETEVKELIKEGSSASITASYTALVALQGIKTDAQIDDTNGTSDVEIHLAKQAAYKKLGDIKTLEKVVALTAPNEIDEAITFATPENYTKASKDAAAEKYVKPMVDKAIERVKNYSNADIRKDVNAGTYSTAQVAINAKAALVLAEGFGKNADNAKVQEILIDGSSDMFGNTVDAALEEIVLKKGDNAIQVYKWDATKGKAGDKILDFTVVADSEGTALALTKDGKIYDVSHFQTKTKDVEKSTVDAPKYNYWRVDNTITTNKAASTFTTKPADMDASANFKEVVFMMGEDELTDTIVADVNDLFMDDTYKDYSPKLEYWFGIAPATSNLEDVEKDTKAIKDQIETDKITTGIIKEETTINNPGKTGDILKTLETDYLGGNYSRNAEAAKKADLAAAKELVALREKYAEFVKIEDGKKTQAEADALINAAKAYNPTKAFEGIDRDADLEKAVQKVGEGIVLTDAEAAKYTAESVKAFNKKAEEIVANAQKEAAAKLSVEEIEAIQKKAEADFEEAKKDLQPVETMEDAIAKLDAMEKDYTGSKKDKVASIVTGAKAHLAAIGKAASPADIQKVLSDAQIAITALSAGWHNDNGNWSYQRENGTFVKNGWKKSNGVWYEFDANGIMKSNCWTKSYGKWFYLTKSGAPKTGWMKTARGNWFWFRNDGSMKANGYVRLAGRWNHFNAAGIWTGYWK